MLIDHDEAYHLAQSLIKKAGFEFHHASMQTETCYYTHPARRPLLMRISTHKSKKSPIGMNDVIARVTFSRKDLYLSEKNVKNRITWAIGEYFLAEPRPTRYQSKQVDDGTARARGASDLQGKAGLLEQGMAAGNTGAAPSLPAQSDSLG